MNAQWVPSENFKNVEQRLGQNGVLAKTAPDGPRRTPPACPQWELDPRDFERSLYEGLPKKREEGVNWTMVLVAVILGMLMVYSSMTGYLHLMPQPVMPTPMPDIS